MHREALDYAEQIIKAITNVLTVCEETMKISREIEKFKMYELIYEQKGASKMKLFIITLLFLAISIQVFCQEDLSENFKGIKNLSITVGEVGDIDLKISHSIELQIEKILFENGIKINDDFNNSKYRLVVSIITNKIQGGYFVIVSVDIMEQAKLIRLNKTFYCRNFNSISTTITDKMNYKNDVEDLVENQIDEIIHEIKKDNLE